MKKRILIVDDEPACRDFLAAVLEDADYEVYTAADGREGYALAKSERPDLISLDLRMPNRTGPDLFRNLLRNRELRAIPVIVVSGMAGRHLSVSPRIPIFDKPIEAGDYLAAVEVALRDRESTAGGGQAGGVGREAEQASLR